MPHLVNAASADAWGGGSCYTVYIILFLLQFSRVFYKQFSLVKYNNKAYAELLILHRRGFSLSLSLYFNFYYIFFVFCFSQRKRRNAIYTHSINNVALGGGHQREGPRHTQVLYKLTALWPLLTAIYTRTRARWNWKRERTTAPPCSSFIIYTHFYPCCWDVSFFLYIPPLVEEI